MTLGDSADHLTRGAALSSEMTRDGMQSSLFLLQSTCHLCGSPAPLNTVQLEDSIPVSAHWCSRNSRILVSLIQI